MTGSPGRPQNIAVIGAGLIGLSCAWALARKGAEVTLYEQAWPPRGASWAAAGMLAPAYEALLEEAAHPHLFDLCMASAALWPDFAAEIERVSGQETGFRTGPTLAVAAGPAAADDLKRLCDERLAGLVAAAWTDAAQLKAIEPSLSSSVTGGVRLDTDLSVDNRAVLAALTAIVERLPTVAIVNTRVELAEDIEATDELGLDTLLRRHEHLLLTAGAARLSPTLGRLQPVRGQALSLAPFEGAPCHVIRWAGGYIVPKPDRIIIGATSEPGQAEPVTEAVTIAGLQTAAAQVCPAIADQPVLEAWAGIRPATRDHAPLIGPTRTDRLFMATGHYRNGILLAPLTAEIVADMLLGHTVSDLAAAFSPARIAATA